MLLYCLSYEVVPTLSMIIFRICLVDNVQDVLSAAEMMDLSELKRMALRFMTSNVNANNCLAIWQVCVCLFSLFLCLSLVSFTLLKSHHNISSVTLTVRVTVYRLVFAYN